jgi:hypothetical protein
MGFCEIWIPWTPSYCMGGVKLSVWPLIMIKFDLKLLPNMYARIEPIEFHFSLEIGRDIGDSLGDPCD